jgi:hypothetical protein
LSYSESYDEAAAVSCLDDDRSDFNVGSLLFDLDVDFDVDFNLQLCFDVLVVSNLRSGEVQ